MRYRIDPQFWRLLSESGISGRALAEHTPHGTQWLYRLKQDARITVSADWVESVVAQFPDTEQAAVRSLFVLVSERYWVSPNLWGLLAARRIKLSRLAPVIGMSHQQLIQMPNHPSYTMDGAVVDRLCAYLEISHRSLYFSPAIRRGRKPAPTSMLAS